MLGTDKLPTNQGVLVGSYASVARMLDELAEVPGVRGVMMTFDDFVIGMEQFGTRIMPLMRCSQRDQNSRMSSTGLSSICPLQAEGRSAGSRPRRGGRPAAAMAGVLVSGRSAGIDPASLFALPTTCSWSSASSITIASASIPAFLLDNYRELLTTPATWRVYRQFAEIRCHRLGDHAVPRLQHRVLPDLPHPQRDTRTVLFLLCAIPFWTSGIIRTIAWIPFLGRNGAFNRS